VGDSSPLRPQAYPWVGGFRSDPYTGAPVPGDRAGCDGGNRIRPPTPRTRRRRKCRHGIRHNVPRSSLQPPPTPIYALGYCSAGAKGEAKLRLQNENRPPPARPGSVVVYLDPVQCQAKELQPKGAGRPRPQPLRVSRPRGYPVLPARGATIPGSSIPRSRPAGPDAPRDRFVPYCQAAAARPCRA